MRDLHQVGGILSYFTRHKTVANLLMVVMIAAGVIAFPKMRAQFFPDVVVDSVSVSVGWDGAGAEDVDLAIVQVIEPALLAIQGVTDSTATSTEGRASVRLEFEPNWDMDRAADDVQKAIDAISNLPEAADDPQVSRGQWSDRVTDLVITGPVGVDQLARFADELILRLFAAGVTQTTVRGVAAGETLIEVPSQSLVRYDVTMAQIADAIAAQADANPAGDVAGTSRVRTGSPKRTAEEISGISLRTNADNSVLTVGDVARVLEGAIDRDRAYFVGENSAITIRVDRSDRGDAIELQARVQEVADAFEATMPNGVVIDLIRTRAEQITGRLNILLENGLMGLGLVVTLLFLFLNARIALWVAAGIPVAMLAAIALMYAAGLTINMISLFALIITLGIVVDDAIVVGEHADFRVRRLGEDPVTAAETAARRMFSPVFSATITTIIAFFGLVSIGGRFGDLISDIPFTVIVVLAASLVECFLILPHHMSHALAHSSKQHWYDAPSRFVNRGFSWVRDTAFRPFIATVIWARYPVIAAVVLVLSTQITLFINGDVTWRFFSSPEQGSISGNFAMAAGADRDDTVAMMQEMQRATEALGKSYEERYGTNPIDFVMAEIGGNAGRGIAGTDSKDASLLGAISIELIDADLRPYSSAAFVSELQEMVVKHPLAETISFRRWGTGPGGDALDIQISGADSETLKAAAEDLKVMLAQFPETSALEDNLAYDKEELILQLTPQGQALGFTIDALGRTLRNRLGGIEAASYPDGPRSATIRVELPAGELTADFLDRSLLRADSGTYVPLADIVSVQRRTGFSTIRRENGVQLISVTGDLSDDDAARATEIMQTVETVILPKIEADFGVQTNLSGLSEQSDRFLGEARNGLTLILIGIYLTLAWIFSSWTRPLVVMAIIPFGLVGTIYGHYVWGVSMSIFTVVGLIGMVGIIINDSIVLVTTVDEYAQERGLIPAIIDGTADRLRPVLLTTLTTVLGLMPLLYEGSSQAQFLKPTVITLVYGLGFGMVLVLMIVPALMAIQADVGKQFIALRRALYQPGKTGLVGVMTTIGAFGIAGLFAATLGAQIVLGDALFGLGQGGVMMSAATFMLGSTAFLMAIFAVAGLIRLRRPA
uniref:efflux RND transporter permease subunit n=3 Tax=Yoonia sp. TaxID=2212373 RepID=UPI0040481FCB